VIVPDDWPTIQQAIDSGADEILVRPGVYTETPVISGYLPPDAYDYGLIVRGLVPVGTSPDSIPVVAGLVFEDLAGLYTHAPSITIADLKFSGAVENRYDTAPYSNPFYIGFTRCVLDSGLTDATATVGGQLYYFFSDCTVEGPIWLEYPQQVYIMDCVVHSSVTLRMSELAQVRRTRFKGPGVFAIDLWDADWNEISNCTFEGFETPIRYAGRPSYTLESTNNVFIGPGIVPIQTSMNAGVFLSANRISGFEVGLDIVGSRASLEAFDNLIEDCGTALHADVGAYGVAFDRNVIRSCRAGVTLRVSTFLNARGNMIEGCGGDGMVIDAGYAVIDSNVVGRCEGAGIRLTTAHASRLTANTSYGNAGTGLIVTATNPSHATSVDHNISHGNGRFGLEVSGLGSLNVGCNDWFANTAGPVSGIATTSTDLTLDPLFCDVTQDDVHLSTGSPLMNAAGCGQIGALGQGCVAPIVSRLTTFTAIVTIEGVELRWQVADAAPGFVAWIERAEGSAGPWVKVECERTSDGEVTVEHDRTSAPARSYWYRLVATDRGVTRALGEPIRVETAPPTRFALLGTGPNPSLGAVEATFQLAHAADITLELFDAQGRRVATLARGSWPAGIHRANWAGPRPASGVYLIRYRHPGGEDLRRIAVVR
jgi:hypothetical protein